MLYSLFQIKGFKLTTKAYSQSYVLIIDRYVELDEKSTYPRHLEVYSFFIFFSVRLSSVLGLFPNPLAFSSFCFM